MNLIKAGSSTLLVFVLVACGGSSGSGQLSDSSSIGAAVNNASTNTNGPLTGDIWHIRNGDETHRFNLETGTTSKISNFKVYPTRDGTKYSMLAPDIDYISPLSSPCSEAIYISRILMIDTRTGDTLSAFNSQQPIRSPVKPSPDGTRLLAISNEHPCDIDSSDSVNVTMYSTNGDMLFRFVPQIFAFDWLPDGRAALLRAYEVNDKRSYGLLFETGPGTLEFHEVQRWAFPAGTVGKRVRGLRSNHDGTKFLMEIVLDESRVVGINYRYSNIILLDLSQLQLYSVFKGNEPDGSLKATEPLFSPNGNWIMATQDYWAGAAVLENNTGTTNPILFTDVATISLPPSGVSYVVPVGTADQLLPPVETSSDTIRPVLMSTGQNTRQTIRLNPIESQVWTPTVPRVETTPAIQLMKSF